MNQLKNVENELVNHPVFSAIKDLPSLRTFMESHVFAVWDFMSLLKRLQIDLTCVQLPWIDSGDAKAARLINEIVLGEETDLLTDGNPISHFEMYRLAMMEMGASTKAIDQYIRFLKEGKSVEESLKLSEAPIEAREFVLKTIDVVNHGSTIEVATWFFNGRESIIPSMFRAILDKWKISRADAPMLVYYLDRHIHLDEEEHGPMSKVVLENLLEKYEKTNEINSKNVEAIAINALKTRIALWDGVLKRL